MFRDLKNVLKMVSVLSLMFLTTFLIKPDAAVAGAFIKTCSNIRVDFNNDRAILLAECYNNKGQIRRSNLLISNYVANYTGALSWATPPGNFQKSCRSAGIVDRNQGWLTAKCGNGKGGWVTSEINLDERVSNQNGVLDYDD
ncbi:CVNH domain-containing protein [Tolypothrix sp. VBCCA 56010]|uniref:mannose-binding lectin n=1 Tax=Tolypothrix sp. VBCCA 56010 TaxID=3137731 RepID=UPI003D7D50A4